MHYRFNWLGQYTARQLIFIVSITVGTHNTDIFFKFTLHVNVAIGVACWYVIYFDHDICSTGICIHSFRSILVKLLMWFLFICLVVLMSNHKSQIILQSDLYIIFQDHAFLQYLLLIVHTKCIALLQTAIRLLYTLS